MPPRRPSALLTQSTAFYAYRRAPSPLPIPQPASERRVRDPENTPAPPLGSGCSTQGRDDMEDVGTEDSAVIMPVPLLWWRCFRAIVARWARWAMEVVGFTGPN
ncbi:hypothetical protein RBB50_003598 [Rhinocladiella similis]